MPRSDMNVGGSDSKNIVNLSSHDLEHAKINVLKKELKFAMAPKKKGLSYKMFGTQEKGSILQNVRTYYSLVL
jgi:hypothetical protein